MRATNLQYRNPKEQTPDTYDCKVKILILTKFNFTFRFCMMEDQLLILTLKDLTL